MQGVIRCLLGKNVPTEKFTSQSFCRLARFQKFYVTQDIQSFFRGFWVATTGFKHDKLRSI